METEEDEYVSIEDSENCAVDSGTNYWNTVLGPSDVVEGTICFGTSEDLSVSQDEVIQDMAVVEEYEEEDDREPLSFELQQGYRILRELMAESNKSVNWHFLEAVDDSFPETHDYYDRIKSPMWLEKMNEKFQCRQYETITQFVSDFRLMLENCFRYNGPDHYVSKRGQRLETMLEQKLALLSRDLREKTSIAATSGQSAEDSFSASGLRRRVKSIIPHDSSALLNHLREEELKQQREQRRQVIADRKAAQEAYLHNLQEWEDQLMGKTRQTQMKAMWEENAYKSPKEDVYSIDLKPLQIPAIGHFLFLCQEPLNLEEVAHYELEHSFMMPRQSSTMQRIMSSLLSTPFQRTKLDKKTMMPYCVWEEKLRKRLSVWYKTFDDNNENAYKAAYKLGIDAFFFDVAGKKNPLLKKKFHELSFYRQVWIVKSLCDNCLETQESLRDAMEVQPVEEQRSYVLGQDSKGNTYIHFPQFCGADLRVYRQDPAPEPEIYSSEEEEELEESEEEDEVNTPPVKKRKVDNGTKVVKNANKQPQVNRRSGRRGQKPSDLEDTEPENTPSEVSTEPGSRSMTATPEIMEDLEEEVLSGRRTRSGRTRRNLYQNGLTRDLERSLRRLRRSRVEDKKCDRDGSPSVASDSEKDYSSATDSNYNNNSVSAPDEQESGLRSSRYKEKPLGSSRNGKEDSEVDSMISDLKQSGDSKDGVKTEEKCDIKSIDNKGDMCEGNLCKEEGSCGAGQCNGHIDDKNKSAITNGDISSEELLASAVNGEREGPGTLETNKGLVHSMDGESEKGKDGAGSVNVKCEMEEDEDSATVVKSEPEDTKEGSLDVKSERASVDAESTSAQIVANGAESDNAPSNRKDKLKDEPGDTFEKSAVSAVYTNGTKDTDTDTGDEQRDTIGSGTKKTEVSEGGEVKEGCIKTDDPGGVEEEEEESEDELTPEIGSFELMADNVEDLRLLTEKFAEQPEPPPVSTRGKKAKAWRPPSRKRCVVELHDRLIYLLKELEPWEPKLIQARRKAQVKMRKELDEYKEEVVKAQEVDEWNTEESSSGDDTDSEMNGNTDAKEDEPKIKRSSTAPSIQSNDSRDSLVCNTEEEYELDVSSRGRLRKRRVIPNNIEDQGIKKKKLIKAGEDTGAAGHLPNILQKQLKPATVAQMSPMTVTGTSTTYNPMQNMSASQILRMSILGQTQAKSSLVSSPMSNIRLSSFGKSGVSVTQSSHPVIQSLLTTRGQRAVPTVLRQVKPRPPVMQSLKPQQTSGQPGVIQQNTPPQTEKQTLEVTGGNTPSSTQKILNSLPASVIQQLLKHKAIKIQTTGPGGTTLFLTSAVPTSSVLTPATPPQSSAQLPQPTTLTQVTETHHVPIVSTHSVVSSPAVTQHTETSKTIPSALPAVSQTKMMSQTFHHQSSPTATLITSQLNTLAGSVSSVLTSSQQIPGNVSITTSPKPVMITPQGPGQTSPKTLPTSPLLLSDTSITDHTSIKPYLSPSAVSPSKQKYASNVTVKALLENRASQKAPDIQAGVSRSDVLEGVGTLSTVSREGTVSKSNVNLCKVVLTSAGVQYKPRVLKIPSQEALDSALQSVVTSVSTSLPTANIKVPSPVTLPSIQPRRNVTKTIQSMKAPIPVAHKVESSPAIRMTSPSSLTPSASQSVTSLSHTQSTKSPVKTGYVLQSPVTTTNTNQKNMLLKVVPQNFLTSQGLVQGYLTPQGLVIPQNKQTIVSGTASVPVPAAEAVRTSNHVQMTLSSSANDSVGQMDSAALKSVVPNPVIVPQGGKQIQLSFSPVKQAMTMSSVQAVAPLVADMQQAGNKTGSKQTIGVVPALSAIQSQCSLTSATFTTASKSGKGVKSSQIQTKVATPAAELVKQIAAGQSSIHNTRMMMPPSGHVVHGKSPSSGISTLIGKTVVSGPQAASVIPAVMVGQPAVASPVSPRLFVPTQQLVGTPIQSGKAVCLTSTQDIVNRQPFVASPGSTLQLTGKPPTSPFVLSLGSGLQNVILSPTKDSPSQPASQLQTAALQISVPQTVAKTTNVAQSMATLQLPVQSMQPNQQVVKLTPQQLTSTLQVNPQPAASGIQLAQQQVAGTPAPKQILLSPQQVGNMAIPSGIKIVPQQPVASGIQTLINKAVPQVVHQKIATLQVAAGNPSENKTPVVLQQQTLPLAVNTPGQILQLGQQQLVINKSIPQPSVVPSQPVQGSTLQPSLKIAGNLQQNQILQFQAAVPPAVSVPTTISTPSLNANKSCIQAAQPATKAALQAHLNQSKPSVLVHGSKPELPTLSTMLGHEKGKTISTLSTTTPHKHILQTTDNPLSLQTSTALSSIIASPTSPTVNATSIKTTPRSEDSSSVAGDIGGSKQQKLLLYNIGGQLMTAQGVPVTVEQGVLKVVPQATIQIGNQMLTIRSPSSAMVENPPALKPTAKAVSPGGLSHMPQENASPAVAQKLTPVIGSASNPSVLIQADTATAAGIIQSAMKPVVTTETKLLRAGNTVTEDKLTVYSQGLTIRNAENTYSNSVSSNKQKGLSLSNTALTGPAVANNVTTLDNSVKNNVQAVGQSMDSSVQPVSCASQTIDHTKPVLQKTGSREEAALNLLSLANMSER